MTSNTIGIKFLSKTTKWFYMQAHNMTLWMLQTTIHLNGGTCAIQHPCNYSSSDIIDCICSSNSLGYVIFHSVYRENPMLSKGPLQICHLCNHVMTLTIIAVTRIKVTGVGVTGMTVTSDWCTIAGSTFHLLVHYNTDSATSLKVIC